MLNVPNFDLQVLDVAILFGAMVSFLAFIWGAKKLLFLLEISDYGMAIRDRKQRNQEQKRRQKDKISNNIFKTSQTKKERQRREKLYALREFRKQTQEQRRYRNAQLARTKFYIRQRALEQREQEKIIDAKRAKLNDKINFKVSTQNYHVSKSGNVYKNGNFQFNEREFLSIYN